MTGAGVLGTMLSFVVVGSGPAALAVAPVISHAPRVATGNPHGNYNTWAASNWSGYAATGNGFTGVSATWTVPSVSNAAGSQTFSSLWVGVDGFNNSNLIQTGTEEDYYNGGTHYNAWWEILPAAETPISMSVTPGDRMFASIYETGQTVLTGRHRIAHLWSITIKDTRTGQSFSPPLQAYTGPGTSAEWVVEAPQVSGRIATLAPYSFTSAGGVGSTTGDFDNAMVGKNTIGSPASSSAALSASEGGVMVQNNVQVSTPSVPDNVPQPQAYDAYYGAKPYPSPLVTPGPTG
jgi:hypothetical protein